MLTRYLPKVEARMTAFSLHEEPHWDPEYFEQYDQQPIPPGVGWTNKRWWTEDAQQGFYKYSETRRSAPGSDGGHSEAMDVEIAPDETSFYILQFFFRATDNTKINGQNFIVTHPHKTEWRYYNDQSDWEPFLDDWVSQGQA